jgi:hypothetical protein
MMMCLSDAARRGGGGLRGRARRQGGQCHTVWPPAFTTAMHAFARSVWWPRAVGVGMAQDGLCWSQYVFHPRARRELGAASFRAPIVVESPSPYCIRPHFESQGGFFLLARRGGSSNAGVLVLVLRAAL